MHKIQFDRTVCSLLGELTGQLFLALPLFLANEGAEDEGFVVVWLESGQAVSCQHCRSHHYVGKTPGNLAEVIEHLSILALVDAVSGKAFTP